MKTTRRSPAPGGLWKATGLGAVAALLATGLLGAQKPGAAPRCRCVDGLGRAIPDCTCHPAPSPGRIMAEAPDTGSGLGFRADSTGRGGMLPGKGRSLPKLHVVRIHPGKEDDRCPGDSGAAAAIFAAALSASQIATPAPLCSNSSAMA